MTKSIELRIPDDLAKRIDERVATVSTSRDEPLSRNAWLVKALDWAVSQPVTTRTVKEQI